MGNAMQMFGGGADDNLDELFNENGLGEILKMLG